ncbi:MAG: 23S rRNA (pseudouridine(1915)-N(3))-methyltransferase RlmH [Eubacteriales bacterium]
MNIRFIAVGKVREKYIADGIGEFLKRLKPFADVGIQEVPDEKAPEGLSPGAIEQITAREGERILQQIKNNQTVVALAIEGKPLSSEQLAGMIAGWGLEGKSDLAFVIGGSLGLHKTVLDRADTVISFGKMTFPHQLMRLMLLEQIYRAFKINRGEPYHK